MKNWLTQVIAAAFAVGALASCEKDENKVTVQPSDSVKLTTTTNSLVLAQVNQAQTAVTYTWNPVQFALSGTEYAKAPAISYELQVATTADAFSFPLTTFDAAKNTSKSLNVKELNDKLAELGYKPGTAVSLFVRTAAIVGADHHTYVSNTVPLTVTPYLEVCQAPAGSANWSIIGPAGVDWNTDVPLRYNCTTNTFDVTRQLNAGEFKFRANSAWTLNYGSNSSTGGALVSGGNNISVATAGVKTIKLDLNNMTYSIQ